MTRSRVYLLFMPFAFLAVPANLCYVLEVIKLPGPLPFSVALNPLDIGFCFLG